MDHTNPMQFLDDPSIAMKSALRSEPSTPVAEP
jgi:hypothetical protein